MKQIIPHLIVGILIGLAGGYVAAGMTSKHDGHMKHSASDACNASEITHTHDHAMHPVDTSLPLPTITVAALPDEKDGYNLHIQTSNFSFAPTNVNADPVQGEGHAHVLVNGRKVARVYGNWYHLSSADLCDGENQIEVTLNANDHGEWIHEGAHVSAMVSVTK